MKGAMNTPALTNKTIVVTGGAGGIGTAICEVCAAAGGRLVVTYNSNAARAHSLVKRLPGDHMAVHAPVDDSSA